MDGQASFLLPMAGVFVVLFRIVMLLLSSWPRIPSADDGRGAKANARVVRQQEALFSSVYEGLIAVWIRTVTLPP